MNDIIDGKLTKGCSKYSKSKRTDGIIMHKDIVSFCPSCKKAWEKPHTGLIVYPHDSLPTYGLKRKHCPNCKE